MSQLAAQSGNGMPQAVDGVIFFERYASDFDPAVGIGGMEVWFPIATSDVRHQTSDGRKLKSDV
jgi:hypothetical protein